MSEFFKKAGIFTDIHIGNKSNGKQFNDDCIEYLTWFINLCQSNNCDTCFFLGDYFHNRNAINLVTMDYGIRGMKMLSDAFEKTIMIPGNHDEYYRDSRSINSIAWANHIPRIEIINEITTIDGVTFSPWLIKDEYKQLSEMKGDYLMSHLELPSFIMTGAIEMPDNGTINMTNLSGFNSVFTGHFHKRQSKGNIHYIGNAFPHNYGDAGDDARGCMILERGKRPVYHDWKDSPKYRIIKLSSIESGEYEIPYGSYIKLIMDREVSYEEVGFLKETLTEKFNLRELSMISPNKDVELMTSNMDDTIQFQSVDTIVQSHITSMVSEFYDNSILLDIYNRL